MKEMTTITIKTDDESTAQRILEMVKSYSSVIEVSVVTTEHTPNKKTLSAIKDAEAGKMTKAKNTKDLFDQLSK
jgi:hypothetical protein